MQNLRTILAAIGYITSYLLALQPFLAEADTCTQGGPDGYGSALIASFAISLLTVPSIAQARNLATAVHWLGVFHLVTVFIYCLTVVPKLYFTNLFGIHICGTGYGAASYIEEYLYAPALLIICIVHCSLTVVGLRTWLRARDFA
ncbi:MAG: hypothetical protein KDK35_20100 [Leptospiraceae bacterium]|nr:hypothetical protein [Leptospiraceae bacterium]MCP5484102.1 hypothetical protein [Spirochaetales bacterium]